MSSEVVITINGKEVRASEGDTLLQAARAAGIDIPTLCYYEDMPAFGACRLCVVEVSSGGGRKKVVASCLYPVEKDLVVETESERIVRHRRMILELIRARWPNVSPELLARYNVPEGRLPEDPNFCIMCGLCVRYCSEVKGFNVLGFVGRGVIRQVVVHPALARKYCPQCGNGERMECLDVCPTGVIVNDYAATPPHLMPQDTVVKPVRARDDDNTKSVVKMSGG